MIRPPSTGELSLALAARLVVLGIAGLSAHAVAPAGDAGSGAALFDLRGSLWGAVMAYAGHVRDAVSIITTLPLF